MDKNTIINYLQNHKETFAQKYNINKLGLFGSYAKGEHTTNSDIDIIYEISPDKKLSMFQYLALNKELENAFDIKVDLVREAIIKKDLKKYIQKDIIYV